MSEDPFDVAIVEAGKLIRAAPFIRTSADLEKGLRYLDGVVVQSLLLAGNADPHAPAFVRTSGPISDEDLADPEGVWLRAGLDNPDNDYWQGTVGDDAIYLISGTRGSTRDFNLQVLDRNYVESSEALAESLGTMAEGEIEVADDGSFEIVLSAEPQEGNWMELPAGSGAILFRETYADWGSEEPGRISIELREGGAGPGDEDELAVRERAARYLLNTVGLWLQFGPGVPTDIGQAQAIQTLPANTVLPPIQTRGGLPDQFSSAGAFELADGESLVVTMTADEAPYQGIQLGDHWFTSLDYVHSQTSLTGDQSVADEDGMVRCVVSAEDPGVANWLDTTGLQAGYLFARWQGLSADSPPTAPRFEVVSVDDLGTVLPADTTWVAAEERDEQIAARLAAYEARDGSLPPLR